MAVTFPELPYAKDALDPHISARTLEFHHGKHHKAYVDNANKLIAGTPFENMPLEDIIREVAGNESRVGMFNNTAQAWNHAFYWKCMKPGGGGAPTGDIADKIQADFGGIGPMLDAFKQAGATQFGSGWAWLVLEEGNVLRIHKTSNADCPLVYGCRPLLTVDVWEHAYYLDYQNRRPDYLATFVDKLINWDFVNSRLR
jgi:Fe-Mn family superoxide dismutase